MNTKPDFLIVGSAKSGTTSLFHYLNSHSDIYIPEIKECRFFSQMPRNQKGLGAEKFHNEGIENGMSINKYFKAIKIRYVEIYPMIIYIHYDKSIQIFPHI